MQRIVQTNHTAGQLSSTFKFRRDDKRYYQGFKLGKNVIPLPTGGITRRPSFKFQVDPGDSGGSYYTPIALIPWQSSPTKTYLIAVVSLATQIHFFIYKRSSGSLTKVHSITTGYSSLGADWTNISHTQSRDTMYIALDGTESVKKLVNGSGGDTDWTLSDLQEIDGPFDDINLNVNLQMDPSAQSGTGITIASKLKSGGTAYYFDTDDIGKLIRIRHNFNPDGDSANYWGCAIITAVSGTPSGSKYPSVTANLQTFGDDNELSFGVKAGSGTDPNATVNWRLGALNNEYGYPTYNTFHEGRLWYSKENRFMGSCSNDFERHSPTLPDALNNHSQTADSAIDVKMADLREEKINWMYSDQVLHVGTNTGRYVLTGSTPSDIKIIKQSNVGVADVKPVMVDNLIYTRYDREALLYADFNFRRDRFEDKSLNLVSDEILKGKVKRLATTNYPFNIIWACLDDGTLASLTYDPEQEITAWSTHELNGYSVTEIVSLKGEDDKESLYALIKKNDTVFFSQRYIVELDLSEIEYLRTGDTVHEALLDCYITLSDTGSLSGQEQYENQTPMVIQNGINYPQTGTVNSSGNFTLDQTYTGDFQVGIPMDVRIEYFPIALPNITDVATGRLKNVNSVDLGLHRTLDCHIQFDNSDYTESIDFRQLGDDVNTVPPYRNKLYNVPASNNSGEDLSIIITQEAQAPLTILGVNYNVEVEDLR